MVLERRLAGVLLHPTSLPGRFGIGDLGPECHRFLDWMRDAGLGYWQLLPLGPTSFGDSPYQCFSAFAGNPMLISPESLVADSLARQEDILPPPLPFDRVDYGAVIAWKTQLLSYVFDRFLKNKPQALALRFAAFRKRPEVAYWLKDYAEFRVCKDIHNGIAWNEWEAKYRDRNATAMTKLRKDRAREIEFHEFCQFLFFEQWDRVKQAAHDRGIQTIGDVPIYVAYDSADTWANREFFQLDKKGLPIEVAGVPPDYFSETGQLWGNPLYDWDKMKASKYKFWVQRLKAVFTKVDVVRIDHFRGFMGFWAVPFGQRTAVKGKWRRGPGEDFFKAMKRRFKSLPIIAEDLGEITPDVIEMRDKLDLPGMKIMQFAWGLNNFDPLIPNADSDFHVHNHIRNSVVYTGTHDNDTTVGWYQNSSSAEERHHMRVYLATDGSQPHWDLIRAAFMSSANTAIIPMQDFLGLDSGARMNFPGKAEGNWTWRMSGDEVNWDLAKSIRALTLLFQRCATPPDIALPREDPAKLNYLSD